MPNLSTPDILLETLTKLSLGEITLSQAAGVLDSTVDDLAEFIEANPDLVTQADQRAQERYTDPQKVITQSLSGLSAAVNVLVERLQREGADMATSELLQSAKTLESLVAFSKQQEVALKSERERGTQKYPLLIMDNRQGGLRIFMIPPTSPTWVDTTLPEYQEPHFSWLETFAPLNPDGEILHVQELLDGNGTRYMDAQGRIFGGA